MLLHEPWVRGMSPQLLHPPTTSVLRPRFVAYLDDIHDEEDLRLGAASHVYSRWEITMTLASAVLFIANTGIKATKSWE